MFAKLSQQGLAEFVETDRRARYKQALLNSFTKEELDTLAEVRSRAWCGTNWEEQEEFRIEQILKARTSAKKPHLMKKILPFLFR